MSNVKMRVGVWFVSCVAVGVGLGMLGTRLVNAEDPPGGPAQAPRMFAQQYQNDPIAIKRVRRCGTEVPSADKIARSRNTASRFRTAAGAAFGLVGDVTIKVAFHVIHSGNSGKIEPAQIDRQIQDLNDAYAGKGFQFKLDSSEFVDVAGTNRAAWFHMEPDTSTERAAKVALGHDTERFLNIYTADLGGGLLGWARFPSDLGGDPDIDGVVLLHSSLRKADGSPGAAGAGAFGLGRTAVHEAGHWLGLFHTFQGGCQAPGDDVDDTPSQLDDNNIFECNEALDTCPAPGKDPCHNFMNYADDPCLNQFTPGQVIRMKEQVTAFRSHLFDVPPALRLQLNNARAQAFAVPQ